MHKYTVYSYTIKATSLPSVILTNLAHVFIFSACCVKQLDPDQAQLSVDPDKEMLMFLKKLLLLLLHYIDV